MMLKKKKFKLITFCLFAMCSNILIAQQSKVDSVIIFLNKSFATKTLDSLSFNKALESLNGAVLGNTQLERIEQTLLSYKNWQGKKPIHDVRIKIIDTLSIYNVEKAIQYGKLQIEQLDKTNTAMASKLKAKYLSTLRIPFRNSNSLEEGFQYYTTKLNQYKSTNDSLCLFQCHYVLGGFYRISGLFDLAIYNTKKSITYIDSSKNKRIWMSYHGVLGHYYYLNNDPNESMKYKRIASNHTVMDSSTHPIMLLNFALTMLLNNQIDSAAYFIKLTKSRQDIPTSLLAAIFQTEAQYNIQSGAFANADSLLQKCWQLINENNLPVNAAPGILAPDYYLAQLRIKQNRLPEAIDLLRKDIVRLLNNRVEILRDYKLIAELYKKMGKANEATTAYALYVAKLDSLQTDQKKYRSITFEAEQQLNEKELSIANLESANKLSTQSRNFMIGIAVLLLILAGSIFYRFQTKKKANKVLEKTLTELKSTQSQLIQSEKMASLGELTAGIAHEIQNPLNFVNNFSEVSNELIVEMTEELDKGDIEEAKAISADIKQNLEKINHHGKRASDIVKGMLEHSRTSTGQKEFTDINALCDDYLRLAYQGLKAKNKDFNATMETHFDPNLPKVEVIPQDIGRVLLNLMTNAFYAVNERNKDIERAGSPSGVGGMGGQGQVHDYVPTVSITTQLTGDGQLLIAVKDNGYGIPDAIIEKIFQPFFTTKPTGQGTGLGLSLAYDIVKAHGGELTLDSNEREGKEFTIKIPIA